MNDGAKVAQAKYAKAYRAKNRERLNQYRREWAKKHPDKIKQYAENYWNKKAEGEIKEDEEQGLQGA